MVSFPLSTGLYECSFFSKPGLNEINGINGIEVDLEGMEDYSIVGTVSIPGLSPPCRVSGGMRLGHSPVYPGVESDLFLFSRALPLPMRWTSGGKGGS